MNFVHPFTYFNRAHWIDYQTYAFNILAKNDLSGLTFDCAELADGSCHCNYPSSLQAAGECKVAGEDVLKVRGTCSLRLHTNFQLPL